MKVQATLPERLQSVYPLDSGIYDEMLDEQGCVRPAWRGLMQALQALGPEEFERRHNEAHKLLRENGVTYNVYGDPDGTHRPWQLDPVPFVIDGEEWQGIAAGLQQRAELLNLILDDLYGPRHLIRNGLLPQELVYSHGGFLRACDQIKVPGKRQLVLYAADLARGPDHNMWVLSDRTQAPSGTGYALENRIAMRRTQPTLFRQTQVHRLDLFFQSLRAGLAAIAPQAENTPRVVVLTPGPFNETFFEHAYLAAFLGYPLVQGDDLTVRDGYVWLKSLTGLLRVDVILRRVDDHYCDPLELRDDSRLGVPGLVEVARRGHVAIANPLGSSVLENPGIQPFLAGIAQHFLGEPLKLPTIATWWCGQPREREYVLNNLATLVIKPTYRQPGLRSVFGHLQSKEELARLRDRILANPAGFVGQEHVGFSTVPSAVPGGFEPRHALLRCFLVAGADGYSVMPGGLTRSATQRGDMPIANQMGSISKDTWVTTPERHRAVKSGIQPQPIARVDTHHGALPSRAADNVFWVGRYAERAEGSVRLLRAVSRQLFVDFERGNADYEQSLQVLLRCVTSLTGTYPGFFAEETVELMANPETELFAVATDESRSGSLAHSLRSMMRAGFTVRDLWSADTWRVIDDLEEQLGKIQQDRMALWQMQEHLDQLVNSLSAFSGLVMESMTRGNGWLMLDIGRRLERGLQLIAILRTAFSMAHGAETEFRLIESLLDTSDNLICYRQHYRTSPELSSFFELLLLDKSNPRSLAYQMDCLQAHVAKLPRETSDRLSAEERLMVEAVSMLNLVRLEDLLKTSPSGIREGLDQQLSRFYYLLGALSETITAAYFRHGKAAQSLSEG